jgi:NAD(P)-dependent dehydrogenase (short-subunit alcohol dehydrogenase family)
MSTDQHTGRVAVVTGASSGIGEATARALAAHGRLRRLGAAGGKPLH